MYSLHRLFSPSGGNPIDVATVLFEGTIEILLSANRTGLSSKVLKCEPGVSSIAPERADSNDPRWGKADAIVNLRHQLSAESRGFTLLPMFLY